MAYHAPITGAPTRALSNVTRLPTAATRKVQQNCNRGAHAARAELPQFTGEHLFAGQRRALRRAERLAGIERTPALMIACALFAALDVETRRNVLLAMAPAMAAESGPCRDAAEMRLATTMTIGERVDLDWAQARLAGGR